ncbi:MAG TPA: SRPBCC domain-containing protein [Solirubrobacteraceae bacterium]|nr:SRPBCC domain-containing protein [Solirubrobacteraceae bacterium]
MTERIERELWLPATPQEVWDTVTSDGWLGDRVSLELRPGGDAEFESDGQVRTGWVEDVSMPERLSFWWAVDDEPASRVELRILERDNGTRLRIVETRPLDVLDLVGVPLPGTGGAAYGPALVAA